MIFAPEKGKFSIYWENVASFVILESQVDNVCKSSYLAATFLAKKFSPTFTGQY